MAHRSRLTSRGGQNFEHRMLKEAGRFSRKPDPVRRPPPNVPATTTPQASALDEAVGRNAFELLFRKD